MALHTLGTAATTSLVCLPGWTLAQLAADVSAIDNSITPDNLFRGTQDNLPGPSAVFGTGSTHGNTTLDTLAAGGASQPLAQIRVGMIVLSPVFPAGTYVQQILTGTSVQTSNAATNTATLQNVAFVPVDVAGAFSGSIDFAGDLVIPNRGRLRVFPGDVVAIDMITGFPILVSAAAIAQTGSAWVFT